MDIRAWAKSSSVVHSLYIRLHDAFRELRAVPARRRNVGRGSFIERDVHVLGWDALRIGRNVIVSTGTWLNVNNAAAGETRITIGDFSYIGRRNFISSGKIVVLGDYTMTGLDCHFLGANHHFTDPFRPYIATGVSDDASIRLGVNCWLGASVTVLGNVTIGHGCVIGAGALVNRDIPPFSIAVGNPARVIKRYDVIDQCWRAADRFTAEMEAAIPLEADYRAGLARAVPTIRMPKRAAGHQRGDLA